MEKEGELSATSLTCQISRNKERWSGSVQPGSGGPNTPACSYIRLIHPLLVSFIYIFLPAVIFLFPESVAVLRWQNLDKFSIREQLFRKMILLVFLY